MIASIQECRRLWHNCFDLSKKTKEWKKEFVHGEELCELKLCVTWVGTESTPKIRSKAELTFPEESTSVTW
jgi:hypothetical protein